jgi:transposase-like protein
MGKGRVFLKLIAQLFPFFPLQLCATHFLRYVDMFLPRLRKSIYYYQNNFLRQIVIRIVLAGNFCDAKELMRRLLAVKEQFKAFYQKRIIHSLEQHFEQLTVHHFHSDIHRDDNITENIIKQLKKSSKALSALKRKRAQ